MNTAATAMTAIPGPVDAVSFVEPVKSVDAQHGFTGIDIEIHFQVDQRADRVLCRIETGGCVKAIDQETTDPDLEVLGEWIIIVAITCRSGS